MTPILVLIIGAVMGAAGGLNPRRPTPRRYKRELEAAWNRWHASHDLHRLSGPEQVAIDRLREADAPPPGWTWQPRRIRHKQGEIEYRLAPPGHIANFYQDGWQELFEPEVILINDDNANDILWGAILGPNMNQMDRSNNLPARPYPYRIFMHEEPTPRGDHWRFRFTGGSRYPFDPFDYSGSFLSAGLPMAVARGWDSDYPNQAGVLFVNTSTRQRTRVHELGGDPDSANRALAMESIIDALRAGYVLAQTPSKPWEFVLMHPIPAWLGSSEDPIGKGSIRLPMSELWREHRTDIQILDLEKMNALAWERLRLGFGLPLQPPPYWEGR